MMANNLACELGLMSIEEMSRIRTVLECYGLPLSYAIADVDKFYQAFFLDKKSADSAITFILPRSIGGVEIMDTIDVNIVKSILRRFQK